jgi:hypothetical protein
MFGPNDLRTFIASLAAQVRAAIRVGIPKDDLETGARRPDGHGPTRGLSEDHVWNDAPGRMTRNGLGSLEIGAGETRIDE